MEVDILVDERPAPVRAAEPVDAPVDAAETVELADTFERGWQWLDRHPGRYEVIGMLDAMGVYDDEDAPITDLWSDAA